MQTISVMLKTERDLCDFRGPNISTPELEAIFGGDYAYLSGG